MKTMVLILLFVGGFSLLTSKEMNKESLKTNKFISNSVYFTTSDGTLYHSGDFGFTFKIVKKLNETNQEVIKQENYLLHLSNDKLSINVVEPSDNVQVIISDLNGRFEKHIIDFNSVHKKELKLINQFRVLIVKIIDGLGNNQTVKLIN